MKDTCRQELSIYHLDVKSRLNFPNGRAQKKNSKILNFLKKEIIFNE